MDVVKLKFPFVCYEIHVATATVSSALQVQLIVIANLLWNGWATNRTHHKYSSLTAVVAKAYCQDAPPKKEKEKENVTLPQMII